MVQAFNENNVRHYRYRIQNVLDIMVLYIRYSTVMSRYSTFNMQNVVQWMYLDMPTQHATMYVYFHFLFPFTFCFLSYDTTPCLSINHIIISIYELEHNPVELTFDANLNCTAIHHQGKEVRLVREWQQALLLQLKTWNTTTERKYTLQSHARPFNMCKECIELDHQQNTVVHTNVSLLNFGLK